ncbi:MAG: copper amine oxidase N-terminal domain-containing protein, partial [Firmicutes bacterium]|nr:copper amine oxidase N-terminal domain-containing protein [Bacillota bacterium]
VVDGNVVESDVAPQITAEGRTVVPLRVISETLGAKVDWDSETKTVTAEKDGKTLSLTIGAKVMDNNGAKLTLDSPAQIVDGRTMVPLRVISESFGCKVDWDGASKTVKVTSGASADNKSEKKETVTLPAYSYKGDDPYTEAVCKKIINDHLYFFDKASVSVPVPAIVDIDDKNRNDVKVWGLFWLMNYDLNGTVLETASGGSFPGCMHLKKTDSGYVVTRFDKAEDGSDYSDSLRKVCENNETRIKKFSEKSDKLNEEIKATLEAYVRENGLDITAYQDYGWDPVMLDVKEESAAFGDEVPELFEFSSGAGGWSTELKLKKDGSFKGGFHDSEMGSTGEGYPNGTMYICEFDGKFTDIKKNEDGSYSMRLAELKTVKEQDEEWIDEGIKYISSFPYGLEEGKDFVLYTPDTLTKDLSEEFLTWWPGRFDEKADKTKLGCWGIYNKTTEYGFFAYEE